MSSVFRARHADTGLTVAVKILPRSLARNATLLQRFLREAKNAEKLQHPNIVAIFDRGMEDGRYYLVMEYVSGGDLLDRVRLGGAMPWWEAVDVIRQTAEALRYASAMGLIHRDVKPANLLMTAQGRVKVADLGLALHIEEEDERVTRDGTTVGTVDYMAPEQARDSRAASARSDIYSLGCTFYFLLTAMPPYPQGDISEKLRMHATAPVPDVRDLAPRVPEAVAAVVKKMMAKQADRRYADYDALLAALDELPIAAEEPRGLVALIDDESEETAGPLAAIIDDEDEAEGGADDDVKLVALLDDEEETPAPAKSALRPTALIDDEPDEVDSEGYALAEGPGGSQVPRGSTQDLTRTDSGSVFTPAPGRSGRRRALEQDVEELGFDLQEAGENTEGHAGPLRGKRPGGSDATAGSIPAGPVEPGNSAGVASRGSIAREPVPVDVYDDLPAPPLPPRESPGDVRVWILRGLLIGATAVLLSLLGLAVWRMGPFAARSPLADLTKGEEMPLEHPQPAGEGASGHAEARAPGDLTAGKPDATPPVSTPRFTPRRPEPPLEPGLLEQLGLQQPIQPAIGEGQPLRVQRVTGAEGSEEVEVSLQRGLESVKQTRVEIADQGPFFLDNPRLGKVREIRGAAGFRPVLVFGIAGVPSVAERSALVVVEREPLQLEGLDIVIDAASIRQDAARHSAWLRCQNAGLILRNCTITVDGTPPEGWSLIEVGEPAQVQAAAARGSLVMIESSTIRMTAGTLVKLHAPGQVWMDRSLCVRGDNSACVVVSGSATGSRQITLARSTCVGAGPVLELTGSAGAESASPVVVRAIGSQFSRLTENGPADGSRGAAACFARLRQVPGNPGIPDCLDYRGEKNGFDGYASWLAAEPDGRASLLNLSQVRAKWPGTDAESQERSAASWPRELNDPWVPLTPWIERLAESAWLLERLPTPNPYLHSWTLARFEQVDMGSAPRVPERVLDVTFDAADPRWGGDLGRFLNEQLTAGTVKPGRLRVRAQGAGQHAMTPVKLPAEVELELMVTQMPGGGGGAGRPPALVWVPSDQAGSRPLIETQGGALILEGARFHTYGSGPPAPLIRATGGTVRIQNCVFTSPLRGAATSQPLLVLEGPAAGRGIRADCVESWFSTGATALKLAVAQGMVRLSGCAIVAGQQGIDLVPLAAGSDRFQADLILDRVTIVSERDLFRLENWTGEPAGPARPWVVTSYRSALIDQFDHGTSPARLGVLLRADPESFARGVLAWQGTEDLYAVDRYVIGGNAIPDPSQRYRPSFQQQWLRLWGPAHLDRCQGTEGRASDLPVRLRIGKLKPGQVTRGDLELVRATATGTQRVDVGAPLDRVPEPSPPAGLSGRNTPAGSIPPAAKPSGGRSAAPVKSDASKSNEVVPFE
jgi:hypothetical protein